MASTNFDPLAGNSKPDENPLAALDAAAADGSMVGGVAMGGSAGDGYTEDPLAVLAGGSSTNISARADANQNTNIRSQDDDFGVFQDVDGNMEEYKVDGDQKSDSEESDEEEDEAGGDNLLDMEGWSLRKHQTEEGNSNGIADDSPEYGTDNKTPSMDANSKGVSNNSRRGIFGGWGSRRGSNPSVPPAGSFDSSDNYAKIPRDGIEEASQAYGEGGITGDADLDVVDDSIDPELEEEQRADNNLRPGDHIFIWQTYGINPRAYQRHAVVFSVTKRGELDPLTVRPTDARPTPGDYDEVTFDTNTLYTEDEDDVEVTVVSFYHFQQPNSHGAAQASAAASGSRRGKRSGSKREFLYDFIGPDGINRKKPLHKVRYGRKVKKGILSQKAGVGTALKKDQVGLILARVQYVLDHPEHMPDHHALSANGECASLWCVTGKWCTLQGASILAITSAGQAGGALLAGGILSNLTILVPMPGVWGMAGWWWYVPATVAYPFLVPMLVALGMASLVPLEILRRNRKKWRGITDGLNHEFWSAASDDTKEEYFGNMATAEKEAEMRSFFGVREGEAASAADSKYMPLGGAPGGMDDSDDEGAEAMAMQQMEKSCQGMASDMNVDLSGRPPSENGSPKQGSGAWGSFMGSFRKKDSNGVQQQDEMAEKQRFSSSYAD